MSNSKKVFTEVAESTGMHFDEQSASLHGVMGGYNFIVSFLNNNYMIYASVRDASGSLPTNSLLKPIKKEVKGITNAYVQKNHTIFTVYGAFQKASIENLITSLHELPSLLKSNGFQNVCESCGKPSLELGCYNVAGSLTHMCNDCHSNLAQSMQQAQIEDENTNENIVAGAVGALLGSLLGVLGIVVIGQLGYIAVIGGIIMAVCTIKGYEMLGKKLSIKSIIICAIIMICMTYVAERVDWVLTMTTVMNEYDYNISFFTVYKCFDELLTACDCTSDYQADVALVYLFTAIGAIPTFIGAIRQKKQSFTTYQVQ